jgi:hypothetical protein
VPLPRCPACGDEVESPGKRGPKRVYCNDACRVMAWRRRHRHDLGEEFLKAWGIEDVSLMRELVSAGIRDPWR